MMTITGKNRLDSVENNGAGEDGRKVCNGVGNYFAGGE